MRCVGFANGLRNRAGYGDDAMSRVWVSTGQRIFQNAGRPCLVRYIESSIAFLGHHSRSRFNL
jgi:hypothetical protein